MSSFTHYKLNGTHKEPRRVFGSTGSKIWHTNTYRFTKTRAKSQGQQRWLPVMWTNTVILIYDVIISGRFARSALWIIHYTWKFVTCTHLQRTNCRRLKFSKHVWRPRFKLDFFGLRIFGNLPHWSDVLSRTKCEQFFGSGEMFWRSKCRCFCCCRFSYELGHLWHCRIGSKTR